MGTPLQWGKPSQTCRIQLDWEDCRSRLFEARQKFKEEEDKRADRSARTKAQKRERQAAAMDEFYADCLKSDRYCAEFKLLLCCFNCVVLSSVVCETGFSVLKQIRTTAPNKLPWSVRAMAFMPNSLARSISRSIRQAPSSRL